MQINPNQDIQLAALISDPSDATIYYVRCVMRDTATNRVLGSVKLTMDPGNTRRFYGRIQAPSMTGPGGRYIDITTTIYADSGYTTPAAAYGEVIEKYLVALVWNPAIGGAGSGDPFAEAYEKDGTRKIIREEFAYIIEEIGKLGDPTVVVEGKAKGPDTEAIARRLSETVATALSKKGKPVIKKDILDSLKVEMLGEIKNAMAGLDEFSGLLSRLTSLEDRIEYLWEHIYMREMTGDGLPLPAASSSGPRSASDGVMPLGDVMQRHTERRAGFFDQAPPAAEDRNGMPEMPGSGGRMPSSGVIPVHLRPPAGDLPENEKPEPAPVLSDFTIRSSKRKPSAGVIPNHILDQNKRALSLMPAT